MIHAECVSHRQMPIVRLDEAPQTVAGPGRFVAQTFQETDVSTLADSVNTQEPTIDRHRKTPNEMKVLPSLSHGNRAETWPAPAFSADREAVEGSCASLVFGSRCIQRSRIH